MAQRAQDFGVLVKQDFPTEIFESITRWVFGLIACVLALFALLMTVYGLGETFRGIYVWQEFGQGVLRGVGYIIVAVAVFEVSKYLVEEEVMRSREMRSAAEARRSLTKFVSTISIAVFLEGLVTVFRVSHESVSLLLYPAAILVTGTILILGLGFYQRLSVSVEREVEQKDKRVAAKGR
jgi:putative Mn2+ efflux pump MntP